MTREESGLRSRFARTAVALTLFLLAVFALYGGTRRFGFVQDDFLFARPLNARQILATFTGNWEPFGRGNAHYRPVVALTLAADYELSGPRPRGYHATNLVLFSLAGLAAFAFLRRAGCGRVPALLASLAWLVHPMSASSAAWCSQRTDSVMAIFYLLALRAALAPRFGGRTAAVVLAFSALALGSKEMAATLPAALGAVLAVLRPEGWKRRLWVSVAATAVLVSIFVAAWVALFPDKSRFYPPSVETLGLMLFPVFRPTSYTRFWNAPVPDPRDVATVLATFAGAAWLAARHRQQLALRLGVLGLVWPLLTLIPVFGLDDPDSYRLGLLPAFGFGLCAAGFAHALRRHRPLLLLAAATAALWLVPIARGSAAAWGPGGFQYQGLLKWRALEPEWQAQLTPEMRALFERQVRRDLGPGFPAANR